MSRQKQGFLFVAALVLTMAGCGPVQMQKVRWAAEPYDRNEYVQEKEGVRVEMVHLKEMPAEFFAQAQACTPQGVPIVDEKGRPIMERVLLLPPNHTITKLTLTNSTEHVLRLNRAVLREFDPAGNQYEPLDMDQFKATLLSTRPCPSTTNLTANMQLIKLYNRNVEIVPGTSFTGYLLFRPASSEMPGVWKTALYDIPVASDEAGNITRKTKFEIRSVFKKYIDYYQADSAFAQPRLIRTEEVK